MPNPIFPTARPFLPEKITLPNLRAAAAVCKGCDLYQRATQTVFGAGKTGSTIMFVGEQPGDQEDLQGKPFVGPAGRLLDKAIVEAGIERGETYVTNAVKHFKWEPRGKKRLHAKPSARQSAACRPWLEAEIAVVKPRLIVALGATAAQSLLGNSFKLTQHRGELIHSNWPAPVMATVHPSGILRMPDAEERHKAYAQFVTELKLAAKHAGV
jgi:DNA polymerase